jgi:hypothetical protein
MRNARMVRLGSAVTAVALLLTVSCNDDTSDTDGTTQDSGASSGSGGAGGKSSSRADAGGGKSDAGSDAASEDSTKDAGTGTGEAPATRADSGAAAASDELWLVETRVYTADEATGYAIPVAALSGEIKTQNGIEQPGGGYIFANPKQPDSTFLLTNGEEGAAVRYEIKGDKEFVQGKKLSLEGQGVTHGYGNVAWIDEHKAYWFDQLQGIRFDPATMEIKNVFQIQGVEREGYRAWISDRPAIREDGVILSVSYAPDWEDGTNLDQPRGATLVHVDIETDELTVSKDDRCTSLYTSVTTADGDSYFFSSYENAYVRIATNNEKGVPACALRVKKGQNKFDPDWSLDIAARVDGRPADGLLPGKGSSIWLRVFHDEEFEGERTAFDDIDALPAWQWYKLDFSGDAKAVKNTDRPYASHGTAGLVVHGRSFFFAPNADYSESELVELKDDKLVKQATVTGELNTVVRVR